MLIEEEKKVPVEYIPDYTSCPDQSGIRLVITFWKLVNLGCFIKNRNKLVASCLRESLRVN